MQVFINESSLENQYASQYEFIDSIKEFISSIKTIHELKIEKIVFNSMFFFSFSGLSGLHLETVLKNVLPPGSYQMQYPFPDGSIVDAVVFVKDKIIPIDSKFSLENYNKMVEEKIVCAAGQVVTVIDPG